MTPTQRIMKLDSFRENDAADNNNQNRNQLADTSFYLLKLMSGEQTEVLVYIIKKKITPKKNTSWPTNLALCSSVFSERRFVRGSTWSLPSSWTPMKYWSSPYIYSITDEYDPHTETYIEQAEVEKSNGWSIPSGPTSAAGETSSKTSSLVHDRE